MDRDRTSAIEIDTYMWMMSMGRCFNSKALGENCKSCRKRLTDSVEAGFFVTWLVQRDRMTSQRLLEQLCPSEDRPTPAH